MKRREDNELGMRQANIEDCEGGDGLSSMNIKKNTKKNEMSTIFSANKVMRHADKVGQVAGSKFRKFLENNT